jgi:hypothetical protein
MHTLMSRSLLQVRRDDQPVLLIGFLVVEVCCIEDTLLWEFECNPLRQLSPCGFVPTRVAIEKMTGVIFC